jgi:hypothetical protein
LYYAIFLKQKGEKMAIQTMTTDLPSGEAVIEQLNRDYLKLAQKFDAMETTGTTDRVTVGYFSCSWEINPPKPDFSRPSWETLKDRKITYLKEPRPPKGATAINVDPNGDLAKQLNASIPSQLFVNIWVGLRHEPTPGIPKFSPGWKRMEHRTHIHQWTYNVTGSNYSPLQTT